MPHIQGLDSVLFHQDNARLNSVADTLQFLQHASIHIPPLLASSHDLSPIEYNWDMMSRSVGMFQSPAGKLQQLRDALHSTSCPRWQTSEFHRSHHQENIYAHHKMYSFKWSTNTLLNFAKRERQFLNENLLIFCYWHYKRTWKQFFDISHRKIFPFFGTLYM